ncbi:hypothetical protein K2173_000736 [Erythroxylum novogranatense]|uniref:pyruvate kinase n=1 Tax=Erythroxylum novogranatense TaxID=1862640 RepID=A0AAV8T302_9ROSI|nr:hypothetical protein K2173_000736 [Erythroxylum novogranatense]
MAPTPRQILTQNQKQIEMEKKAKIVRTLGPASRSIEMCEKLLMADMNVARFNFSHGSDEYHQETLREDARGTYQLSSEPSWWHLMDDDTHKTRLCDNKKLKKTTTQGDAFQALDSGTEQSIREERAPDEEN